MLEWAVPAWGLWALAQKTEGHFRGWFVKTSEVCYDSLRGRTMKRAETYWQAIVLSLVFMITIGIWVVLGWLLHRLRTGDQVTSSPQVPLTQVAVQIIEPLDGSALLPSSSIGVRSALMEPGFVRAELQVDGRVIDVQVNPEPESVPWIVQWEWQDPGEGAHILSLQARRTGGEVEESAPVMVTVVPPGRLVFASNRNGAYAIYAMQTDGNDLIRRTGGPGDGRQPAPRKDGALAFVAEGEGGQSVIRLLRSTGGEEIDLLEGVDPAWASDGVRLAYATGLDGVSQVFATSVDGGPPTQVTAEEVYAGQPTWSPDGTRLAYVAEQEGNWDIWVASLDGSDPNRLTDEPGMDWAPTWSPDGSQLAFVSDRGGSHQIYVMQADGTGVRMLSSFTSGAEAPAWSPDGFWLACSAYTGDGAGINAREIYLMRSDGKNQVRLTDNSFDDTDVAWVWMP
jgi:hypothetical protein